MIAKLRTNFRQANMLAKVVLVCAYVFANWKNFAGALTFMTGSASWPMILFGCALSGLIVMLIANFVPKMYLRFAKIYTVPVSEFCLFSTLAWAGYCLVLGTLNLVYLFAPTFLVWGSVIFPVVSVIASGTAFYLVTSKLYFNDATRFYYFKTLAIVVLVLAVFVGV